MTSTHFVWIALLALLVFWAVGAYNRLMRLKNTIANAFGLLDVHLKRRYELILPLVEAAQKYLSCDAAVLEVITLARSEARSASDAVRSRPSNAKAVTRLGAAEAALSGGLGLLTQAEDCPDLRADETIKELTEELTSTDHKMTFARQTYNDAVRDYNHAQGEFPTVVLARLFGFGLSALLQATPMAEERQTFNTPPSH